MTPLPPWFAKHGIAPWEAESWVTVMEKPFENLLSRRDIEYFWPLTFGVRGGEFGLMVRLGPVIILAGVCSRDHEFVGLRALFRTR